MRSNFTIGLLTLVFLSACSPSSDGPVSLIFDTDWWTDVDDACAVRILSSAAKAGEIDLKGVCLSAVDSDSYESIGKFLAYEGLGDVLVGADKQATDFKGHPLYRGVINASSPRGGLSDADVTDCVRFYRQILSSSRGKVDIVAVGFPNTLSRLLESGPDRFSRLSGVELVKKKVGTLYLMAGKYPEGREHNFCLSDRSRKAGKVVCDKWPGEIVFLGFEVGIEVVSGGSLPQDDLLHKVLEVHGSGGGRYMWDPLTLVMAIKGSPEAAGFSSVRGTCILNEETGENKFAESPDGLHRYVKMQHEGSWYAARLDAILSGKAVNECI